jgi:hypothetical protein
MFSRLALRTTRSVPRTTSAFRSFHASPPSNNDQGESAVAEEEDDNIGNDGVLGNLFGNPYTSIPLCGLGVMTATATDFYILDAETQLLGLWCMFVGTCYFNFSDPIANYFDDLAANVQKDQNAQEDLIIDAMEVTKGAHQRQTAIFEDIQAIYEAQKVVMESLVAAKTNELGHIVRASVVQKLDNVVTQESRMTATIQSNLVDAATEQVRTSVTGDRAKTMALENAFAAIADPTAASTGKDPVSSIYSKFFNDFNARLADASANETELSAELRAEMEAEMKSVAARDGLDFVNIAAPATMKL